ncbi:hypothetical protein Q1695_008692 [Nippostrongylus brasiliensis]|nr:hypothetical protein Q1695_008692 [Nippostrongylus brasiliensis]
MVKVFVHITCRINRARSDPAIHQMSMHMMPGNGGPVMFPHHMQAGPSGSGQMMPPHCSVPNNIVPSQQGMVPQQHPLVGGVPPGANPQQGVNMQTPLQSPLHYPMQGYGYPNGSPLQSPMGSPMGSSLMLDDRTTPMMELSPPGMHDPCSEAGSLPNLQHHGMAPHQQPPPFYHQTVGQRHSTGGVLVGAPRLAPVSNRTPESQSAPTSPANNLDPSQHMQWHGTRTFSNSPESLDIPRLVLTNPEGTNGPHLECFNDLQHLTLDANDMQILCNGTGNGNPPQQSPQPNVYYENISRLVDNTLLNANSLLEKLKPAAEESTSTSRSTRRTWMGSDISSGVPMSGSVSTSSSSGDGYTCRAVQPPRMESERDGQKICDKFKPQVPDSQRKGASQQLSLLIFRLFIDITIFVNIQDVEKDNDEKCDTSDETRQQKNNQRRCQI